MQNEFPGFYNTLFAQGNYAAVEALALGTLATTPDDVASFTALGAARQRLRRFDDALAAHKAALSYRRDAERCYRMGDVCHDLGRLDEAQAWLDEALTHDAGHWRARYTLAVLLQDLGRDEEAIPLYRQVLAAEPGHARSLNNLGSALHRLGRHDEAVAAFRGALERDPAHPSARANLSGLLAETGATEAAREVLAPALGGKPPGAINLRAALLLPVIPLSSAQLDAVRADMEASLDRLIETPPRLSDPLREIGRTAFPLAFHGRPNRVLMQKLASVYRRACPDLLRSPERAAVRGERIRVTFASTLLFDHPVGRLVEGLVERLPRERFEVSLLFIGGDRGDYLASRLAGAADRALKCGYDLDQARLASAELAPDVLVLPDTGIDPLNYFLGFARIAPVQCTTWGHPCTSGLEAIDYYVSTAGAEPAGADDHYSERLIRFDGVAAPAPLARPNTLRGQSRLAGGGPALYCPQPLSALHPDFDTLLARLLRELPTARLHLLEGPFRGWTERMRQRLRGALAGIDVDQRIVWLPRLSPEDHMATLAAADLVLESPQACTPVHVLEALAIGKPVLTLLGATLAGRISAGIYDRIGCPQLVAANEDEYLAQALRLTADPVERAGVGETLRALQAAAFGERRVIDAWADFLQQAVAGR